MREPTTESFVRICLGALALLTLLGCSGSSATSNHAQEPNAGTTGTGGSLGVGTEGGTTAIGGAGVGGATVAVAGTSPGGADQTSGGQANGGGGNSSGPCTTPPAASALQGWAAVSAMNVTATDGGGDLMPEVVTTLDAFKKAVTGDAPAVVYLNAVLPPAGIAIGSNKTIVGICGAEVHGHLGISKVSNVIVRNLKIVGYGVGDCAQDPSYDAAVGCSSGDDAVSISSASHHIWFDHCDISDGTDGNLDINAGSDFVTISWTKFHYSPRTDPVGNDSTGVNGHRFSNLIGSGDMVPEDVGHLNVTFHHDWWADNVNQRMPRTRRGKIHVVNNLYSSAGNKYCTNSGYQASLLVENNVYTGVSNPLSPDANGDMLARNNIFTKTSGTTTATGTGFTPPYPYTPEDTAALEAAIRTGAGPH
jgi:pectate lyase